LYIYLLRFTGCQDYFLTAFYSGYNAKRRIMIEG
jgi:hypothetical protein